MAETGERHHGRSIIPNPLTGNQLTVKQEQFCVNYVANNGNAAAAARSAGYECESDELFRITGYENLTKPHIVKRIKEIRDELSISGIVTAEYVVAGLKETAERCMQKEPILDNKGNPTGEYKFDSSGANRSHELLGKTIGIFIEKVESKNTNTNINLSDEEKIKYLHSIFPELSEPKNGVSDTVNNDFP